MVCIEKLAAYKCRPNCCYVVLSMISTDI